MSTAIAPTVENVPNTALGRMYQEHIRLILEKDIDGILNQYTDDAVLISRKPSRFHVDDREPRLARVTGRGRHCLSKRALAPGDAEPIEESHVHLPGSVSHVMLTRPSDNRVWRGGRGGFMPTRGQRAVRVQPRIDW